MTELITEKTSPFSLAHEWSVKWTILPSHVTVKRSKNIESVKENAALEAIAAIGLIGGKQLARIYGLDKQRLKRMTGQKRIIRHEVKKNKMTFPVYTLGPAVPAGLMPGYVLNYWQKFFEVDVLKKLLFFQLFNMFPGEARILSCASPFTGSVFHKGVPYYVYVLRGNAEDLLSFLKWTDFQERMLIITEKIEHLKVLDLFLLVNQIKIRVLMDEDFNADIKGLFYRYDITSDKGMVNWVREA